MGFDLIEIGTRTQALMKEIGEEVLGRSLLEVGWTFRYDRAKRRLGSCKWKRSRNGRTKLITLSQHFSLRYGWGVMEDVVRHEIAHAVDFETRGRSDHGPTWQRQALLCGADPTRLYEGPVLQDGESRYVGICPSCGEGYPYYRRLRRAHACPDCCKRYNGGRYADRYKLTIAVRANKAGNRLTHSASS